MMRRGRIITAAASVVVAVAFAAPAALAAGPQTIGRDLADGRLDGTYSKQELADYVRNAAEQGYGGPVAQAAPSSGILGGAAEGGERVAAAPKAGTLAFTGFDLTLLAVGALFLLALGAVLRWASRERALRKREW
jgi:hypothetical protein